MIDYNENVIEDLKEFVYPNGLKYNSRKESANAVANYFRECNPKTEKEYNHFYETCDDYMYENAFCNKERSCKIRTRNLLHIFSKNNFRNVLEVGAGVGTYALSLEQYGCDVDVIKSCDRAFDFFKWRIDKYKSSISIKESIDKKYDCIYFFDVIEHVLNPFHFLDDMCNHSDAIIFTHGFKVHTQSMGGYPQHFDFKFKNRNIDVNKWTIGNYPGIQQHIWLKGYDKIIYDGLRYPPHIFIKGYDRENKDIREYSMGGGKKGYWIND